MTPEDRMYYITVQVSENKNQQKITTKDTKVSMNMMPERIFLDIYCYNNG